MSGWDNEFSYCDNEGAELELILCENGGVIVSVCAGYQAAFVGFSGDDAKKLAENILAAVEKAKEP